MTGYRAAILALLLAPSAATAEPVAWWYNSRLWAYTGPSTGVSYIDFGIDPATGTFLTEPGVTQNISLTSGVRSPWLIGPIPLEGPTILTQVDIWDTASGDAYSFRVPIEFHNSMPAPWGEWDTQEPRLGKVLPGEVVLGRHKFQVTRGPELSLNVGVSHVPEPATLLMGVAGLAGIGFARRRIR